MLAVNTIGPQGPAAADGKGDGKWGKGRGKGRKATCLLSIPRILTAVEDEPGINRG